jgi:hypothetical protein
MPPQAYALVTLFALSSIVLGWAAVRIVSRSIGGPRGGVGFVLPILAAFGAFYLIGHRLGLSVGPQVSLFGFQVALLGDLALGFAAALLVALAQSLVTRVRRRGAAAGQPEGGR